MLRDKASRRDREPKGIQTPSLSSRTVGNFPSMNNTDDCNTSTHIYPSPEEIWPSLEVEDSRQLPACLAKTSRQSAYWVEPVWKWVASFSKAEGWRHLHHCCQLRLSGPSEYPCHAAMLPGGPLDPLLMLLAERQSPQPESAQWSPDPRHHSPRPVLSISCFLYG